jgi:hypothetical protein
MSRRPTPPSPPGGHPRPRRWGAQALAVQLGWHKFLSCNAAAEGERLARARALAADHPDGSWERAELRLAEQSYETWSRLAGAQRDLLGGQGVELPADFVAFGLTMTTWEALANAYFRDPDASRETSPGATDRESRDRPAGGTEGERRQACEPAGPARGSRGADHFKNEPGGASTPPGPSAADPKKGPTT